MSLSIASMTGFARASGELQTDLHSLNWAWEIKSVNGKALDVKVKLPLAYEDLSIDLKNMVGKYLQRGSVNIFLELNNAQHDVKIQINESLLKELTDKALDVYYNHQGEMEKPRSSEILAIRGVVEIVDNPLNEDEKEALRSKLLSDFEGLCQKLAQDRKQEGKKIKTPNILHI